ncbi:MAG: MG2 domain-containing protein [Candidatus Sumerlaeaceae bacterium]|nr:MG2 domain-containing protein [Candidatus Sumerlaeaceae bacterium]
MTRTNTVLFIASIFLNYLLLSALWAQPAGEPERGFRVVKADPQGVLPAEKLKQPLEVRVQFSSEVVRAVDVGTTSPCILELVPHVGGPGRWRDEKTFVWTLDPRQLPAGTEVRYRVVGEARDLRGRTLTGNREFMFVTPPLAVLGGRQVPVTVAGGYAVQLEFNYPVNPDELANFITAKSGDHPLAVGGVMAAEVGKERRSQMRSDVPTRTPIVQLAGGIDNEEAIIEVAPGLPPARGGKPLAARAQLSVKIQPTFVPLQAYGYWKGERGFLAVEFTAPVSLEGAAENVSVLPPVKFSVDRKWGRWGYAQGENALVLSGDFQPETRYAITIRSGLKSAEGQPLGKDRTLQAWMPKVMPFLTFDRVGGHLSPQGTMKARVRSSGVREFSLHIYRLYENNLTYYLTRDWDEDVVAQLGTFVAEKTVPVGNPNGPTTTHLDLREFVTTGSAAGVYLLRINAPYPSEVPDVADEEERYQRYSGLHDHAVVVLSNLGVVGKCGESQATVWVTALDTAQPIAGASVQWFSQKNQLLGESLTDALGVAHLENISADFERRPFLVVVRLGHDFTYLKLGDNQLPLPAERILARERPFHTRGYEAFVTTERGAYRPGELVHLMGFLRGVDYQPPKGAFPIELCVQRADGVMLEPMRVIPTPSGAFEASISLPRTAPTGLWRGILRLPGQNIKGEMLSPPDDGESSGRKTPGELGRVEFFVEEFMPTRLEVKVDVPDKRLATSETVNVRVRASELFGQPAAERPFSIHVLYQPEPFVCPDFAEYTFGDATRELDRTEEGIEELTLNAQGEAAVPVPLRVTRAPAAVRAEIQTVVQDPGGRTVTKREIRRVDPVPFYVGVRLGTSGIAEVNKPLELRVVAVRPDCSPASDVTELSATISRVVWDSILKRSGGSYSFVTTQRLIPQMSVHIPLANGRGQLTWTPPVEGEYVVVVSALEGGAQTRVPFYASSGVWGSQPWSLEKPEELEIVADKSSYEPGDVARVLVKAPFAGTLLVSLEQDRVTSVSIHPVTVNTAELELPIEPQMAPNVFVTATLVRPVRPADKWLPHRAFGTLSLPVHLPERQLAATLQAPSEIRPDSRLDAELVLSDAKTSAPVEGDVFVWAVDEGVLALTEFATPDPWQFYYGPRRLGVTTADFYADLMPDLVAKAESAPGGGEAAMARRMSPVAAERVRSVVLWAGLLRTDSQGRARVSFRVPAYAGKLRLMAMAGSGARFASSDQPVIVRGPVVVREHFPRFLSPADIAQVPIVLYNNNTETTTRAFVTVVATGPVEIEGERPWERERSHATAATTLTASLEIDPRGQRTAFITLKAKETVGVARLRVTAAAGDFRHEESLELPVRPATVPKRVAGRGFVQPGSQLRLELPHDFMAGTTTGVLTVGHSRAGELVTALQYNITYPYGCAEQLISAGFPVLAASEIVKTYGEENFTSEGVAQLVATACERLSELQTLRGGLAMWPGEREPWLWASLYGAHFWLEARRAGYSVAEEQLEALLKFIKNEAFRSESGGALRPAVARERAYAVYVLALAGRPARDQMELLYDRREELPLGANALLAAAYWKLGMHETAKQVLAIAPEDAQQVETGRTLASPTREAAILLSVLCEVEPSSARTRALAEKLYAQIKPVGHWGSTQDNAFAVWALARFEKSVRDIPAAKGVVRWRGKELVLEQERQVVVGLDTLQEAVEILSQGPGPVFYSWFVEGVPLKPSESAEAQGLKLTRRYLDTKGREVALDALKPGQAVFVELTVKAERPVSNVAVVDLLPAALEIENPKLETAERGGAPASAETLLVDRLEARDDRMIIFTSLAEGSKNYVYRYLCRVVSAGNFTAGPAWAECMYAPEWRAYSPPTKVGVVALGSR